MQNSQPIVINKGHRGIFTHPEFSRFTSGKLCPSLTERGEKTPLGGFGVSELKNDFKFFQSLIIGEENKVENFAPPKCSYSVFY
jgi:hypothetical protein